jgi:BASS family bile acid:Na+ symporter
MEELARFLASHALGLLMLSVGLRTSSSVVDAVSERARVIVRALLVVWVGVPLLAALVIVGLRPPEVESVTLMVMAICPGVPLVLGKSRRSHGDPTTSLLILIMTAISALVMLPLWAAVLSRTTPVELSFRLRDVAQILLPTVIVPYALGRLIADALPEIARPLARIAQGLFLAGVMFVIAALAPRMIQALRALDARDAIAALLVAFGAATLGYAVTPRPPNQQVSVTYAAALGNPALALAVLTRNYASINVVPVVLAFVVLRAVALVPFSLWFKLMPRAARSEMRLQHS